MEFIQHSIMWAKGEMFESLLTGAFGVLLILVGFLFWKLGQTPAAKAMLLPLVAAGLLLSVAGGSGYFSNQQRVQQYEAMPSQELKEFVKSEKQRVDDFQSLYTYTQIFAAICFVAASVMFWLSINPHLRAVAITLALLGLAGLVIDFFSKERADIYYAEILEVFEE